MSEYRPLAASARAYYPTWSLLLACCAGMVVGIALARPSSFFASPAPAVTGVPISASVTVKPPAMPATVHSAGKPVAVAHAVPVQSMASAGNPPVQYSAGHWGLTAGALAAAAGLVYGVLFQRHNSARSPFIAMVATQSTKKDGAKGADEEEGAAKENGDVQRYQMRSPLGRLRSRVNSLFGHRLAQIDAFRDDPFTIADQLLADVQDEFREFKTVEDAMWHPSVDVKDTPGDITFHCDVPGVRKEDLVVDLQGNRLLISGQREKKTEDKTDGWQYVERSFGSFNRSFIVPPGTKRSDISASYKDGVLEVKVKKQPPAKEDKTPITIE